MYSFSFSRSRLVLHHSSPRAVDQFHIGLMAVPLFLHIRLILLPLHLRTTPFPPSPHITILLWIILMTSLSSMTYRYRVRNLIILSHFNSCICNSFDIQCSVFFFVDGSGRLRRRRGPTLVRDVWQLPEGERIVIECNKLGQPIKKAASLLTSFLGTVARRGQLCPLNYSKWNDMLPAYKIEMLRVVQVKKLIYYFIS